MTKRKRKQTRIRKRRAQRACKRLQRGRAQASRATQRATTTAAHSNEDPGTEPHRFLRIDRFHRSEKDAEQYALALFQQVDPSVHLPEARNAVISADLPQKKFRVTFADAARDARESGTADNVWTFINRNDPYFVLSMTVAT